MKLSARQMAVIRDGVFAAIKSGLPLELQPFLRLTNRSTRHMVHFASELVFSYGKETVLCGRTKGAALVIFPMNELPIGRDWNLMHIRHYVEEFVGSVLEDRLPKLLERFRLNEPFGGLPNVYARRDDGAISVAISDLDRDSFRRLVEALPTILGLSPETVMLPRLHGDTLWDKLNDDES